MLDFSPMLNHMAQHFAAWGYGGIFVAMCIESLCVPLPSEVVLAVSGYLLLQGQLAWWPTVLCAVTGSAVGASVTFCVARSSGRQLLQRWGGWLHLTPAGLGRAERLFARYGLPLLPVWRLLPIVRTKISLVAGLMDLPYRLFIIYSLIGMVAWVLIGLSIGYFGGQLWPGGPAAASVVP